MNRRTITTILMIVSTLVVTLAQQAGATFPGINGSLVVTRDEHIYRIEPDGSGDTQLTTNSYSNLDPVWSPTGNEIAFVIEGGYETFPSDYDGEIWVMDRNGGSLRQITRSDGWSYQPTWSPDGSKIAFTSDRADLISGTGGQADLYVTDSVGLSSVTRLTNSPETEGFPAWSPDGTKIAFVRSSGMPGAGTIYVMSVDGSDVTPITMGPDDSAPDWSPDGSQIVFQRADQVYLMEADGSNPRFLVKGTTPRWSPDGRWVIFSDEEGVSVIDVSENSVLAVDYGFVPSWGACPGDDCPPNLRTPSTLTILLKRAKKLVISGLLTPVHPGQAVTVTLLEKKNGGYKQAGQRDAIIKADGTYKTALPRAESARCKVVVAFAGDDDHLPAEAVKPTRC